MANETRSYNSPSAPRIVHLGLGAFFRAHGAVYIQNSNLASGQRWSVTGVSLKSPKTRDLLAVNKNAYHVLEKSAANGTPTKIDVLDQVLSFWRSLLS